MVPHPSSAFPPQAGPWLSAVMLSLLTKLIWRVLLCRSLSTNIHQVIMDQAQPRLLSWDPSAPLFAALLIGILPTLKSPTVADRSLVLLTKTSYARPGKPGTRCLNSDSHCLLDATPVLEVWASGDWQRCPERPEYCAAVCSKLKHSILEGRYPHQISEDNEILKAQETQKVIWLKRSLGWAFQWRRRL